MRPNQRREGMWHLVLIVVAVLLMGYLGPVVAGGFAAGVFVGIGIGRNQP